VGAVNDEARLSRLEARIDRAGWIEDMDIVRRLAAMSDAELAAHCRGLATATIDAPPDLPLLDVADRLEAMGRPRAPFDVPAVSEAEPVRAAERQASARVPEVVLAGVPPVPVPRPHVLVVERPVAVPTGTTCPGCGLNWGPAARISACPTCGTPTGGGSA